MVVAGFRSFGKAFRAVSTTCLLGRSPPRSLGEREAVMSPSTAKAKVPQALKLTAALAATSGALHQTLLAVGQGSGRKRGGVARSA